MMSGYCDHVQRMLGILTVTPDWARLQALRPDCDDATVAAIMEEAARFAEGVFAPLNTVADRNGCEVREGRVCTPQGYIDAYQKIAEAGWLAMDIGEVHGGMNLPLTLQAACATFFERACLALMMAAGSSRAAAHLLIEVADPSFVDEWVPKLVAGAWSATICISEPDAGSDVGRIRTAAHFEGGRWLVNGQKIWITFGDHDMTDRIGHCLLARTKQEPGTRGLSLFLVPDRHADGSRNGVFLERIEEKMGLHGSPTCALHFDEAEAILMGQEGRGLPQLFAMIERMRLQTGGQGLALATAACEIAEDYADQRRQGGEPDRPAVPISSHPDIRRQLLMMRARTEIVRAALAEISLAMDLARLEPDAERRKSHADFSGFMLPLFKNFGADIGFSVSNAAIQVLGGAGYTKDWPLEQFVRDARVMTIYEGTTGIQAIDLLTRRIWRDGGAGLTACLERAEREIAEAPEPWRELAAGAVHKLCALVDAVNAMQDTPDDGLERADSFMRAVWSVVSIWMAIRLLRIPQSRDAACYILPVLAAEFSYYEALCL